MSEQKLTRDEEMLVNRLLHLMRSTEIREQHFVIEAVTALLDGLEEKYMIDPPKGGL